MSKLQIAGVILAVLIGSVHGVLALIWDETVDQDTTLTPADRIDPLGHGWAP